MTRGFGLPQELSGGRDATGFGVTSGTATCVFVSRFLRQIRAPAGFVAPLGRSAPLRPGACSSPASTGSPTTGSQGCSTCSPPVIPQASRRHVLAKEMPARSTPPAISLTPNGQRTARRRRIRRWSTQRCSRPVGRRTHRDQRSQRGGHQTSRKRRMTSSWAATVPRQDESRQPSNVSNNLLEVGVVDTADGPIIVHPRTARPKYLR